MSKTFTNREVFGKQRLQEMGVKGMKWGVRRGVTEDRAAVLSNWQGPGQPPRAVVAAQSARTRKGRRRANAAEYFIDHIGGGRISSRSVPRGASYRMVKPGKTDRAVATYRGKSYKTMIGRG